MHRLLRRIARHRFCHNDATRRRRLLFASSLRRTLPVDQTRLARDGSYDTPDFVIRRRYLPIAFTCKDCGAPGIWSARRQKWWYEVAGGSVWSTAKRCRPCRRLERERLANARREQTEGQIRNARLAQPRNRWRHVDPKATRSSRPARKP
jgi:hypothetical protein